MKHFKATIEELGADGVKRTLTPEYHGDVDYDFLVKFWELREPNVVWYKIEEIND